MSPRRSQSVWGQKAAEVLADAEWHHGPTLVRELMKLVPPAVALRESEVDRVIARAGGAEAVQAIALQNPDEPRSLLLHRLRDEHPRRARIPPSDDALIESGRFKLVRVALREKIRSGVWELRGIDHPPVRDEWRKGEWEIRDVHSQSRTLSQLCEGYGMTQDTLRRVITDYGIPVVTKGRITRIHIDNIVDLDRGVEKFQQEQRMARTRALVERRRRRLQEELDRRRQP